MAGIKNFTLLCAGYFCIPINLLKLQTWMQLNYCKADLFGSGFSNFLSRDLSSLRLILPCFLGKIFPSVLPNAPRILSIFILADDNRNYFRPHVNTKYGHSNLFKSVLSSAFGRFFICMCLSVFCRIFKRTIWRSLEFPFCAAFSSLLFFSADFAPPDSLHCHA